MPGRCPASTVAAMDRHHTYRRWVVATTLGELVAFSVPTTVWGFAAVAGLGDQAAYLPVVLAGAGEGAVLGYAQTRALRHDLPALDTRAWVRATAAAGALGWAVGLVPSAFHGLLAGLPPAVLVPLGAAGAAVLLASIGAAQAAVLRRHVHHAGRWVAANALGWLAGLPVVFAAFAVAPEHPAGVRAAFAVAGAVGMGFTVAAVTGRTLLRLLRNPRRRPSQPLRRRALIHLNHAHTWAYARTRGRLGRSMGGHPVLLLTTVGRRSGTPRTTPVQYERIDGDLFLVAAAAGAPDPPAWWRNLEADPAVTVQLGGSVHRAHALTVAAGERRELWARLCERNPQLERVQRRAGRELPVVRIAVAAATDAAGRAGRSPLRSPHRARAPRGARPAAAARARTAGRDRPRGPGAGRAGSRRRWR
jgi:deazaflavin-dependent oxidoreductase (nitroreductase family)